MFKKIFIGLVGTVLMMAKPALAEGQFYLGLAGGFVNTNLKAMDSLIVTANSSSTQGPITTSALGNGFEATAILGYRLDGSIIAVHLAPTYYFNSEEGTGQGNAVFKYAADTFIAMPMLRVYAMENDLMSLFFQFGVGWGVVAGEISEGPDQTKFTGSTVGYQGGLGLQMCYEKTHCLNLEGNIRMLDIERNIVSSTTSSGAHANGRVTQSQTGAELEVDGVDLGIDMSGFQFLVGYVFRY